MPSHRGIQILLVRPVKINYGIDALGIAAAHGEATGIQLPAEIFKVLDHGITSFVPILSHPVKHEKTFLCL